MNHTAFVLASYGVFAAVFAALIVWLFVDRRTTLGELRRLEEAGVRRRSDADGPAS